VFAIAGEVIKTPFSIKILYGFKIAFNVLPERESSTAWLISSSL
jgi:hypothetical protein